MLKTKQNSDFEKRVMVYYKEEERLAKKLKLSVSPIMNFKNKKITLVSRFAVYLLRKNGAFLDKQFNNLKK